MLTCGDKMRRSYLIATNTLICLVTAVAILTSGASVALADSRPRPVPIAYCSRTGFCLEVRPDIGVGDAGSSLRLSAVEDGALRVIWKLRLPYTPAHAIVSDSGSYVALVDKWYEVGTSDSVLVLLGPDAKLIRSYRLYDLLSQDEINNLPRVHQDIWWSGLAEAPKHWFDELSSQLVLVFATNDSKERSMASYKERRIDLATGTVIR